MTFTVCHYHPYCPFASNCRFTVAAISPIVSNRHSNATVPSLSSFSAAKPGIYRRGVILAGEDITEYHTVFTRMSAPVYALALQSALGPFRARVRPADPLRCSARASQQFGASLSLFLSL